MVWGWLVTLGQPFNLFSLPILSTFKSLGFRRRRIPLYQSSLRHSRTEFFEFQIDCQLYKNYLAPRRFEHWTPRYRTRAYRLEPPNIFWQSMSKLVRTCQDCITLFEKICNRIRYSKLAIIRTCLCGSNGSWMSLHYLCWSVCAHCGDFQLLFTTETKSEWKDECGVWLTVQRWFTFVQILVMKI